MKKIFFAIGLKGTVDKRRMTNLHKSKINNQVQNKNDLDQVPFYLIDYISIRGALRRFFLMLLVLLIRLYQYTISPLLGANCRFQPTCSAYAIEALQTNGFWHGSAQALNRISRCHPWGGSGFDPVECKYTECSEHKLEEVSSEEVRKP